MTDAQSTPLEITDADRKALDEIFHLSLMMSIRSERDDEPFLQVLARHRIAANGGAMINPEKMQHVAHFDEGQFQWMSGIAARDCELFAMRKPRDV